jgi:hypothetical protein
METVETNSFVGTWRLVSMESSGSGGEVSYPMGRDAIGYICYGEDGYMTVTITAADRAEFSTPDLWGGTAAEKLAAFDTYLSYCGTYEVRERSVIHRIETSLFPNWVGTQQERFFEFRGDRLILRTPPMIMDGAERVGQITWERYR